MTSEELEFERRAKSTLDAVVAAFDEVDSDDADLDVAADVVTVRFRDGTRVVLNTQRPARQLWLAGGKSAWHFAWDATAGAWIDVKGSGAKLHDTLANLARTHAGLTLRFGGER